MIDTHAHLNFPQFVKTIDKVVFESKAAGVTNIIIASSNLEDSKMAVELAKKYPRYLLASIGIHPHKTDPKNCLSIEDQLSELEKLIKQTQKSEIRISKFETNINDINPNDQNILNFENSKIVSDFGFRASNFPIIVAIGEAGLDFSPAPPGEKDRSKEEQEKLFFGQIKLAEKYNIPLIVHARQATNETINIISNISNNNLCGTFHCYTGGKKRIPKILNLSGEWYFGFDGNLTYDEGLQNIIQLIPPKKLLIETDSPFLAPVPHRGEVNTPAYLPFIQQKINDLLGKDLTKQIEENSQRLFCL